jgi:SAM-dependent methyltransferase
MSAVFKYQGALYPEYLRHGNAAQFAIPYARHFCKGRGFDVGAGQWPFPGSTPIDVRTGGDALNLPASECDYVFSSHCLEHLPNPVAALEHWASRLRKGGALFLYLPHPDMRYWRPENCRKHLHTFWPDDVAEMVSSIGFRDVLHSERDLAWSFSVVGVRL